MNHPALEIVGLEKRFGRRTALDGIDLRVERGEFVVVLGPTGAGKTTLLRSIAGLESPDAGTLRFAGQDGAQLAPAQRDVALVFQNFSLYPTKTVRENLEFPLRAPGRRLAEKEITERVRWAASLLHIEKHLPRPARALSGGEMQRVAIGRAIVRRPKLFLMDEPLSNLDAKLREELRVELRDLVRTLETPTVWVTHDQNEALTMADRIVMLEAGRVLQSGTPEDLYLRPASPQVARHLGAPQVNVLEVRRVGSVWHAGSTPIAPAAADAPACASLGIRPEAIELHGGQSEGTVLDVEDLGPTKLVLAHWCGTQVRILVGRDVAIARGDRIRPRVSAARAILWPSNVSEAPSSGE